MGICASQNKAKPRKSGELENVVAQVRVSRDCDTILQMRAGESSNLNPFKNPILIKRIKEINVASPNNLTSAE